MNRPPWPDASRSATRAQRIGLFGGTFDPVHHGHLRSALELRDALGLEQLRLLPNRRPAHRDTPGASAAHRLEMLELAVTDVPGLTVDARELERDGATYTVDSLEELAAERPDASLVFCLGMDAFNDFDRWHRPERVLELAHLIVVDRPGAILSSAAAALLARQRTRVGERLDDASHGVIARLGLTRLEISATRIRRDVAAGRDVRFLLPSRIRAYILDNGLYRTDPPPILTA